MAFVQLLKADKTDTFSQQLNELKAKVHDRLIEILDLSLIEALDPMRLKQEIGRIIEKILVEDDFAIPMNAEEKARFCQ